MTEPKQIIWSIWHIIHPNQVLETKQKNDNYLLSTYYVPSTLSAAQVVKTPKEKKKNFKPEEKKKGSLRVREHAEVALREN